MTSSYFRVFYYALLNFIFFGFFWGTHMYLPYYFASVGLSDRHIGFLISLVSLTTFILVFPVGVLGDRIDPRKLFFSGAVIAMIFPLLFLAGPKVSFYEPYILVFGLAVAVLQISLAAVFLKQMEEFARGGQSAIYTIGGLLGSGIGAQLSGLIVSQFGPANLFWSPLGFSILAFVFGLGLPKIKGIPFRVSEYKEDLRHPLSWILIFTAFIMASHTGFEHAGYTLLQTKVIGLTAGQAGTIFFYIALWMAVISWISGLVHDRAKKPVLYAGIALIVSGLFQAASGYGRGYYDFVFYRMIHTMGDSFSGVLILVIASVVFAKKRAGGAWAILLLVRNAADFTFANLAGNLNQTIGFRLSFLVSGIILLLAGIAVIFVLRPRFWKEIRRVEETGTLAPLDISSLDA